MQDFWRWLEERIGHVDVDRYLASPIYADWRVNKLREYCKKIKKQWMFAYCLESAKNGQTWRVQMQSNGNSVNIAQRDAQIVERYESYLSKCGLGDYRNSKNKNIHK